MQIFAYDKNGRMINAHHASRNLDYVCMGCGQPMRMRGGAVKRRHFYHKTTACRLSSKSMTHMQTQLALYQLLPKKEVFLEQRFPQISRIADLYWEKHRIVFEVQCSAITRREVLQRNQDYAALGICVIWILHDRLYNKKRVKDCEFGLYDQPCYYTNINEMGYGIFYDQLRVIRGKKVFYTLPPLKVDLTKPLQIPGIPTYPKQATARATHSIICFAGDTLDRLRNPSPKLLHSAKMAARHERPSLTPSLKKFQTSYLRLFDQFLLYLGRR